MKKIILAFLLFAPVFASASIDVNLKYGATGAEVVELQEFLIGKGFLNSSATGNFFSLTLKAVKDYQLSVGLPNTGFVGPMTRGEINPELSSGVSVSNTAEITETGAVSTPTKNDPMSQILAQIKALQDQLKALQEQSKTLTETQTQVLQQVAANTTKPVSPPTVPTTISLGTQTCNFDGDTIIPVTISGPYINGLSRTTEGSKQVTWDSSDGGHGWSWSSKGSIPSLSEGRTGLSNYAIKLTNTNGDIVAHKEGQFTNNCITTPEAYLPVIAKTSPSSGHTECLYATSTLKNGSQVNYLVYGKYPYSYPPHIPNNYDSTGMDYLLGEIEIPDYFRVGQINNIVVVDIGATSDNPNGQIQFNDGTGDTNWFPVSSASFAFPNGNVRWSDKITFTVVDVKNPQTVRVDLRSIKVNGIEALKSPISTASLTIQACQ